jgi:hypothetical protein
VTPESADAEAPQVSPGRKRLQMPMVSLKFSGWEKLMKKRISREVEERVAAEVTKKKRSRLDRTAIREILSVVFYDLQQLLIDAISIHVQFYEQVAAAEAGFDLGLKPDHIMIGEPSGWAVVFATINADSCARLLKMDGTRQVLKHMTRVRKARYRSKGIVSKEFDEEEAIMDLLVSALPYTTRTIGMSTPSEIIDRAFGKRLEQFDAVAALRGRAPDAHTPTLDRAVLRSRGRSGTLH